MKEYFILARSFAAPFVSDESTGFIKAETPVDALNAFAKEYGHPAGLYSAACYENANSYHKGGKILAKWLSNHARAIEKVRPTSLRSNGPGYIEMDGRLHEIKNPKAGHAEAA